MQKWRAKTVVMPLLNTKFKLTGPINYRMYKHALRVFGPLSDCSLHFNGFHWRINQPPANEHGKFGYFEIDKNAAAIHSFSFSLYLSHSFHEINVFSGALNALAIQS